MTGTDIPEQTPAHQQWQGDAWTCDDIQLPPASTAVEPHSIHHCPTILKHKHYVNIGHQRVQHGPPEGTTWATRGHNMGHNMGNQRAQHGPPEGTTWATRGHNIGHNMGNQRAQHGLPEGTAWYTRKHHMDNQICHQRVQHRPPEGTTWATLGHYMGHQKTPYGQPDGPLDITT